LLPGLEVYPGGHAQNRRKTRSEIVEKIWRRFMDDPDVEIAYPHMKIVKKDNPLKEREFK